MSTPLPARFRQAPDRFAAVVWGAVILLGCVEFVALFWLDIL